MGKEAEVFMLFCPVCLEGDTACVLSSPFALRCTRMRGMPSGMLGFENGDKTTVFVWEGIFPCGTHFCMICFPPSYFPYCSQMNQIRGTVMTSDGRELDVSVLGLIGEIDGVSSDGSYELVIYPYDYVVCGHSARDGFISTATVHETLEQQNAFESVSRPRQTAREYSVLQQCLRPCDGEASLRGFVVPKEHPGLGSRRGMFVMTLLDRDVFGPDALPGGISTRYTLFSTTDTTSPICILNQSDSLESGKNTPRVVEETLVEKPRGISFARCLSDLRTLAEGGDV
jgi:hypothetical protein